MCGGWGGGGVRGVECRRVELGQWQWWRGGQGVKGVQQTCASLLAARLPGVAGWPDWLPVTCATHSYMVHTVGHGTAHEALQMHGVLPDRTL